VVAPVVTGHRYKISPFFSKNQKQELKGLIRKTRIELLEK
jgi:hypothetical protein